ncbi:MAG: sulfotransferase [Acidimicrobiales bacterium]
MSPEQIRIQDLAEPVLSDHQRGALAFGEQVATELSVSAVLTAAVHRTGLDDFGPDDFRDRLGRWLGEVDRDRDRTGLGRLILFNDCVRYAANRLRIHDLLARHPDIHDEAIVAPIIVVGLPRSGTTHLVNLIAADPRLRSLPLWESYEPVPTPGEPATRDASDPRHQRCAGAWKAMQQTVPFLAAMHPMAPDHVHEELELQLPDFTSYELEWVARVPEWRDHYRATDQTPHYEYLRTVLKILQWYSPGERWVLKSPQHLEQLGPLLATFPDATVVVTHRDPVSVIQSAATMVTYGARMSYRTTEPEWYLAYWADRIERLLSASVRDRHLVPADRSVDVLFHEFMADDVATVERIYETADLTMTAEARTAIDRYRAGHERGRDGQVVYDVRRDFGAEPEALRAPFAFYFDRFAVQEEVR